MTFDHPESHVIARFDAPAFVRRARDLDDAWQSVVANCRGRYEEYLLIPKLRLATLLAQAGEPSRIATCFQDPSAVDDLTGLFDQWKPRLRAPIRVATSSRDLHPALQQLLTSFERFNHRWRRFVAQVPLEKVNELREAYNRYYLLEKECAMRSPAVARDRFESLSPVRDSDLIEKFPLLPVPLLND